MNGLQLRQDILDDAALRRYAALEADAVRVEASGGHRNFDYDQTSPPANRL